MASALRPSLVSFLVVSLGVSACGSSSGGGDDGGSTGPSPTGSSSGTSGSGSGSSSGSPSGGGDAGTATLCDNSGDVCTCAAGPGGNSNTGPCSAALVGQGGVCCASPTWPSSGTCQCSLYGCSASTALCFCGVGAAGPRQCAASNWMICCLGPASCSCDRFNTTCQTGEQQVASCDNQNGCAPGQVLVTTCR